MKYYSIKAHKYSLFPAGYMTFTMNKIGMFYAALHESELPKLRSVVEARTFFNEHAFKHHNLAKGAWIQGPRGAMYKI